MVVPTFVHALPPGSVGTAQLGAAVVTAEKHAALAVLAQHIANGAVTTQKIAEGAVTAEKIAALAITAAKLADKTVTGAKLADDIPYTKFGLSAEQVRNITAGTAEPSGGSDGDIYIQYTV